MTNILLTGSSRGIGAAIAADLNATPDISFVGEGTFEGLLAQGGSSAALHEGRAFASRRVSPSA